MRGTDGALVARWQQDREVAQTAKTLSAVKNLAKQLPEGLITLRTGIGLEAARRQLISALDNLIETSTSSRRRTATQGSPPDGQLHAASPISTSSSPRCSESSAAVGGEVPTANGPCVRDDASGFRAPAETQMHQAEPVARTTGPGMLLNLATVAQGPGEQAGGVGQGSGEHTQPAAQQLAMQQRLEQQDMQLKQQALLLEQQARQLEQQGRRIAELTELVERQQPAPAGQQHQQLELGKRLQRQERDTVALSAAVADLAVGR